MDEVLKRRLIGAIVLLTAAFIVASVLPDPQRAGRAGEGAVVTYDLRTGQAMTTMPAAAPPAAEPAPEAPPPRKALKVDETLGEDPSQWYVQIASFESQANARNALQKLYGLGLPTTIQSVSVGKNLWYRVRVGPYPDEAVASQALATVRKQGYPLSKLVRPEKPSASGRN